MWLGFGFAVALEISSDPTGLDDAEVNCCNGQR
jgi:hypothetical protein